MGASRHPPAKANPIASLKTFRDVKSCEQSSLRCLSVARRPRFTPIDTSTLINSQFREIMANGTVVTGRVGYSANYAVYVHDPAVKQNFTRATARKEFLTKGFEDTRNQIDAVVKELSL